LAAILLVAECIRVEHADRDSRTIEAMVVIVLYGFKIRKTGWFQERRL